MYCTNCGKQIPNDSVFCENCGAKVSTPQSEKEAPQTNRQQPSSMMAEKQSGILTPGKIALYVIVLLSAILLTWGICATVNPSDGTIIDQGQDIEHLRYTLDTGAVVKEFDDWHIITPNTHGVTANAFGVSTDELNEYFSVDYLSIVLSKNKYDGRIFVWSYGNDDIAVSNLNEVDSLDSYAYDFVRSIEQEDGFNNISDEICRVNDITYIQVSGNRMNGRFIAVLTVVDGNGYWFEYQYNLSYITDTEAKNTLQKFLSNITY